MTNFAAEKISLARAQERLTKSEAWVRKVLRRLEPRLVGDTRRVLEIGAAQGRALIGLARCGYEACGVEPYAPAIAVARDLAAREGVRIDLREGCAEAIPFESSTFELVLAFSVMEHVENLDRSLREIYRVLKPGGVFWFNSASAMCPRQQGISGFPCFGWYPDWLKLKIMWWAVKHKPHLVGGTEHPAIHWWTPRKARRRLREAGFAEVLDRWDLRHPEEDPGLRGRANRAICKYRPLRPLADIVFPGCSYTAIKSNAVASGG